MASAALGLQCLHERHVVHRDVKPANFLVFDSPDHDTPLVKITDFGLARVKEETRPKSGLPGAGTPLWWAPEIYEGLAHDFSSDVFSFGLVIYEITTQMSIKTLYATLPSSIDLCEGASWQPSYIPSGCPKDLIALIVSCLSFDPKQRPSMERVKESLQMLLL